MMGKRYAVELQLRAKDYYGKVVTMVVLFEENSTGGGESGWLQRLGLGTGDLKGMKIGDKKTLGYEPVALDAMIG